MLHTSTLQTKLNTPNYWYHGVGLIPKHGMRWYIYYTGYKMMKKKKIHGDTDTVGLLKKSAGWQHKCTLNFQVI